MIIQYENVDDLKDSMKNVQLKCCDKSFGWHLALMMLVIWVRADRKRYSTTSLSHLFSCLPWWRIRFVDDHSLSKAIKIVMNIKIMMMSFSWLKKTTTKEEKKKTTERWIWLYHEYIYINGGRGWKWWWWNRFKFDLSWLTRKTEMEKERKIWRYWTWKSRSKYSRSLFFLNEYKWRMMMMDEDNYCHRKDIIAWRETCSESKCEWSWMKFFFLCSLSLARILIFLYRLSRFDFIVYLHRYNTSVCFDVRHIWSTSVSFRWMKHNFTDLSIKWIVSN